MAKKKDGLAVEFQNIGIGKRTARLGMKLDREEIALVDAEALFVGARLRISIEVTTKDAALIPGALPSLDATVDCKQLSVRAEEYAVGLTFNRKELDEKMLCAFTGRTGTFEAERVGDSVASDGDDDEAAKEDADE